jgi:two-component system, OmpR family, response regulator
MVMKILVVEDNEKLGASLKRGLEDEGYAVDLAGDGKTALRLGISGSGGYDLVILDLMLPELDGIEVCRQWRERGIAFPVLMLTARDSVPDRVAGLDSGADDYLPKPFAFDELCARVRALLRRQPAIRPNSYRSGDIEIDPATHTASVAGLEARLTLKEFRLLELFVRHAGQVLTREGIVDNLWDFEFDGFSNVVDVHVKNLRKKIEAIRKSEGSGDEVIETVRGVGYRFKG